MSTTNQPCTEPAQTGTATPASHAGRAGSVIEVVDNAASLALWCAASDHGTLILLDRTGHCWTVMQDGEDRGWFMIGHLDTGDEWASEWKSRNVWVHEAHHKIKGVWPMAVLAQPDRVHDVQQATRQRLTDICAAARANHGQDAVLDYLNSGKLTNHGCPRCGGPVALSEDWNEPPFPCCPNKKCPQGNVSGTPGAEQLLTVLRECEARDRGRLTQWAQSQWDQPSDPEACPTCVKGRADLTVGPHSEGWGRCLESFHFRHQFTDQEG